MPAAAGILFTARMLKRIRRLGGMARMGKPTPEQRSELGKKAAAVRWKKDRHKRNPMSALPPKADID
jgi:hypothetical protein